MASKMNEGVYYIKTLADRLAVDDLVDPFKNLVPMA